jgi:very-short-patch-repair endonuclease
MVSKPGLKLARAFRRNSSVTERLLWRLLRDRKLDGLKFGRQVPMGPYILDFVCHRHQLVVEADGPFHDPEHDAVRDAWLVARGFRVLRFTNSEIHAADHRVANKILLAVNRAGPIGEF